MLRNEDKKLIKPVQTNVRGGLTGGIADRNPKTTPTARPALSKAKAAENRFRSAVQSPTSTKGKATFARPVFGRHTPAAQAKTVDDPTFLTKENSSMGWQSRLAMNKQTAATHRAKLGNANNLQVSGIRANAMLGAEGMRQEGAGSRQGSRQAFLGNQQQRTIDANKDSAAIATQDEKDLAGIKNDFQTTRDKNLSKYTKDRDNLQIGSQSLSEGRFGSKEEAQNFFDDPNALEFGAGFNTGQMTKPKGYTHVSGKSQVVRGKGMEGEKVVQTQYPGAMNEDTGQFIVDPTQMTPSQMKQYIDEMQNGK